MRYVGKVISADGYRMDNKEIAAVQALKTKPPVYQEVLFVHKNTVAYTVHSGLY